uniref:Uncharacterized protein n=1 Tax=Anguilla anguilla TaxID=7936 RepID=A0A0E9WTS4_ANGAN
MEVRDLSRALGQKIVSKAAKLMNSDLKYVTFGNRIRCDSQRSSFLVYFIPQRISVCKSLYYRLSGVRPSPISFAYPFKRNTFTNVLIFCSY